MNFRRRHEAVFACGDYLPLEAVGSRRDHVCAFARVAGDQVILSIVPRLVVRLGDGAERPPLGPGVWGTTRLLWPPQFRGRRFVNLFTGEELAAVSHEGASGPLLGAILGRFPVALLWSPETAPS